MATTRLSDVIVPSVFTDYVVQNTMEKTALVAAGVATRNNVITSQLQAGADSYTVPFWLDLGNDEADIVNDDPDHYSTPKKINTGKQLIRKAYLHQSWSAMNLASELAGSDAIARIQDRTTAYWERQLQRRLIASLSGVMNDNIANDDGDMVLDISAGTGDAAAFGPEAVIDAAGTLGDSMDSVTAIAMHSDLYRVALKADLIEFVPSSNGSMRMPTYRGLAVVVDDGLVATGGVYTSILFGAGAVGYGMTAPRVAEATEIESLPSAGNGGGQQILHSRVNLSIHPAGFAWVEGTIAGESPSLNELTDGTHWDRVVDRKAVPLAFLVTK